MVKSSAKKITTFLFDNNYIDTKSYDYEVYNYGFEILIASIINFLVIFFIGFLLDKLVHTIIFLLCYCPLRQFAGGYHASSYRKCLFVFVVIFIATIFIANNLAYTNLKQIIILFSFLNCLNISLLAPVEHYNNPLSDEEKKKHKKTSRIITFIIFLFILISSNYSSMYEYLVYPVLALFWINVMMNVEILKIRRNKK